ncbi:MAG: hypothetical protein LUH10_13405 [Tannerellaceae bacterium]|nr:hypothetical protein [Tannerellaceae bacterium]
MKIERNNLDDLKNKNPFKVPEGYMQNLTSQVMDSLPEKVVPEATKVSLMDRMRPWMYMAAMFAGLGLFFRFFVTTPERETPAGSVYAVSDIPANNFREMMEQENEDYLEFIESQYEGVLLAEEWKYFD